MSLARLSARAPKSVNKEKTKKELERLKVKIGELQNILFCGG